MDQRISLVTLGVEDLVRSREFYEALGWSTSPPTNEHVVFFDMGGYAFGLFGRAALAEDAATDAAGSGFRGVALGHNVRSEAEVDETLAAAVAVGATLVKAAEKVFWGGYSGYFADPDGHLWEIAHNPFFPLDENGRVSFGTGSPPAADA